MKARIELKFGDLEKVAEGVWNIVVWAQLFNDKGAPGEKGIPLLFAVDGSDVVTEFLTNDLGVAEATLTMNGAGHHAIYARVDRKVGAASGNGSVSHGQCRGVQYRRTIG